MDKKVLFIYNPHSGKGKIKQQLSDILEILRNGGYETTVFPTKSQNDATNIVLEKSSDYDMVVCVGGDGTLHEVTEGLMQLPSKIRKPCGYIPAGTVNDFATSLDIPKDMTKAANAIIKGKKFKYDIGSLNNNYFAYIAGFGAFMDVSYATAQFVKNIFGKLAYIFNGVKELAKITPIHMKVEINNEIIDDNFMLGVISNSYSIAGIVNLKDTEIYLDDGLFEVILVKMPKSPIELQETIADLKNHETRSTRYYVLKTNSAVFHTDTPISWTVDGEYGGEFLKSEFKAFPQAIEYIIGTETDIEGEHD